MPYVTIRTMILFMRQPVLFRVFVFFLIGLALPALAQDEKPQQPFDEEALRQLADRGSADAEFEMGIRYLGGEGLEKDPAKAATWLQKAADQQHPGAMNAVGTLYEEGIGVAKDEKKAFDWYQKAAKSNFPLAEQNLAECYENGRGVDKNEKESLRWLSKAAHQELPQAQAQYAWRLEHGQGIDKSTHEAAEWYLRAAQQGLVTAMTHLAYMYYTGIGVPLDYRRAEAWYRRAGRSQDPWAHNDLAWFLATCPDESFHDADTAVEFAKSATDKLLDNKRYEVIDTLAAALARSGKFGEAVQTQMKAIVMLSDVSPDKDKELKGEDKVKLEQELAGRLALYRKHQPYTEKDAEPENNAKPLPDDRILQEEMPHREKRKGHQENNGDGRGAEIS